LRFPKPDGNVALGVGYAPDIDLIRAFDPEDQVGIALQSLVPQARKIEFIAIERRVDRRPAAMVSIALQHPCRPVRCERRAWRSSRLVAARALAQAVETGEIRRRHRRRRRAFQRQAAQALAIPIIADQRADILAAVPKPRPATCSSTNDLSPSVKVMFIVLMASILGTWQSFASRGDGKGRSQTVSQRSIVDLKQAAPLRSASDTMANLLRSFASCIVERRRRS
jgi:hypothetical protein